MGQRTTKAQKLEDLWETEIRILPDGAVVIMDLDEGMLDLALALDPEDGRLRQRVRLLQTRRERSHGAKPHR